MSTASSQFRFPLLAAGILGLTGVALGAFGAHALKAMLLERGMSQSWETAVRYHLFHAVALIGVGTWLRIGDEVAARPMLWSARLWCIGVVLFSGSLYGLALGGPRWLGPITPLGGVFLLIGWIMIAVAAFAKPR